MKNYTKKALKQFGHKLRKQTCAPSKYTQSEYGKHIQYANTDTSPLLTDNEKKRIQKIAGKFLHTSRTVDYTMANILNEISIEAPNATERTKEAVEYFLDYCATNPEATIIYRASDMQLQIDSDAAYLVAPKARSRAAEYQFLGNKVGKLFNGPIFVLVKTIKAVMAPAAEAECGGLYMNAQEAIPFITALEELGHKQDAVPIKKQTTEQQKE